METVGNGLAQKLIQSQAVIVQHSLIGIETPPIPIKDDDVLRNSIDELLKFLLRLLAVLDIGSRRKPANDLSFFVSQRLAANQKPAKLAILSEDSRFDFPTFAAGHGIISSDRTLSTSSG